MVNAFALCRVEAVKAVNFYLAYKLSAVDGYVFNETRAGVSREPDLYFFGNGYFAVAFYVVNNVVIFKIKGIRVAVAVRVGARTLSACQCQE